MRRATTVAALCALAAPALAAQSRTTAGVTAGAVQLTDQRSERALTGVVEYQPNTWLLLSAVPAFVHVSDDTGGVTTSASGPGDLPLSAAAFHAFPSPGLPVVAAALTLVLPTGDAACGLGSGQAGFGVDVGASVAPARRLRVAGDVSRSVAGTSAQSILSAPHATTLRAGATYDVSAGWKASASLGADVGQADSTQPLTRMAGAGLSRAIAGALALTLDGSVGLTSTSPRWAVSLGFGTAFVSTSPVSLSSPLGRLGSAFGGGAGRAPGAGAGAGRAKSGCG